MLTVYGIKNCDTVKRARQRLQDAGIAHRFHDFRADGFDATLAQRWIDALGLDTLLNRRGTTWRALDDAAKARAQGTQAAALLAEQPTLIQRPVFDRDGALSVGFAKADEARVLDWLRG